MSTVTASVDRSNHEQAQAWDGDEGAYWAAHADHFDRSVAGYHRPLLAAAAIGPIDRVLDIGCGTGATTRDAARAATAGGAVGVDLSAAMIDLARTRAAAEGTANVEFLRADAQVHPFDAGNFDLAISRTGAMFFGDPVAAFTNIGRALRPGGRLALLTWQPPSHNEWIGSLGGALTGGRMPVPPPDAPGPFALADADRVRRILTAAGFTGVELDRISTGMWFGTDADDAYAFVVGLLGWMLQGHDDQGRARALDALHATLAAHETDEGVIYGSAAWIIRAVHP